MNTNVTKSCVNKTHINLSLHNAQGCHDSVNEITPSNILHAPVQDSETKIPRITANDKVVKYSYDDVQNDFRHFCLMALYLAQGVRTRHQFVF